MLAIAGQSFAQHRSADVKEINSILSNYSRCVIEKDSVAFYNLFNNGTVTWCAAVKNASHVKEKEELGVEKAGSNYFERSYQGFMRALYRYQHSEDKFDNIHIVEDGTVAAVTMDYSFWANHKMTNWGSKYLTLIKRDGQWKITSVIYSLELTKYFAQPTLEERRKLRRETANN